MSTFFIIWTIIVMAFWVGGVVYGHLEMPPGKGGDR